MNIKEINHAKKKTGEELQQYLHFRRRGFAIPLKRVKGLTHENKSIRKWHNVSFLS